MTENMEGFNNQSLAVNNRWRFEGDEVIVPKLTYGDPMGNAQFSSRWIENGAFVKLQEVALNYHIPSIGDVIKHLDVYITAKNIGTLDEYLGYDPEFSYGFGYETMGIDYGKIPALSSIMLGLKVGF
jgi:hypothetical protein